MASESSRYRSGHCSISPSTLAGQWLNLAAGKALGRPIRVNTSRSWETIVTLKSVFGLWGLLYYVIQLVGAL